MRWKVGDWGRAHRSTIAAWNNDRMLGLREREEVDPNKGYLKSNESMNETDVNKAKPRAQVNKGRMELVLWG